MKIHNFLRLMPNEQYLLVKTIFLMWIIKIMLFLVPFKYTRSIMESYTSNSRRTSKKNISIEKLIWAVEIACNYVPYATCLTKALAGQILFTKENYKPELKIGVLTNDQSQFEAHAWLLICGKTVIGESNKNYTPLLNWK